MKDLLGKHIKVNIYGTFYDGTVTSVAQYVDLLFETKRTNL